MLSSSIQLLCTPGSAGSLILCEGGTLQQTLLYCICNMLYLNKYILYSWNLFVIFLTFSVVMLCFFGSASKMSLMVTVPLSSVSIFVHTILSILGLVIHFPFRIVCIWCAGTCSLKLCLNFSVLVLAWNIWFFCPFDTLRHASYLALLPACGFLLFSRLT